MNVAFYLTPKSSVIYLNSDSTVKQGMEKMHKHGYSTVPVIDKDGCYVGTISEGDILWFLYDLSRNGNANPISEAERVALSNIINSEKYKAVHIDVPEDELIKSATEQNFVPVVDDRRSFIGIVTRKSILDKLGKK